MIKNFLNILINPSGEIDLLNSPTMQPCVVLERLSLDSNYSMKTPANSSLGKKYKSFKSPKGVQSSKQVKTKKYVNRKKSVGASNVGSIGRKKQAVEKGRNRHRGSILQALLLQEKSRENVQSGEESMFDSEQVSERIKNASFTVLQRLHVLLFGAFDKAANLKANILSFKGFPFHEGSEEWKQKEFLLSLLAQNTLREYLDLLCLEYTGDDQKTMINRLMKFLAHPTKNALADGKTTDFETAGPSAKLTHVEHIYPKKKGTSVPLKKKVVKKGKRKRCKKVVMGEYKVRRKSTVKGCSLIQDFILPALRDGRFGDLLEWHPTEPNTFRINWMHKAKSCWSHSEAAVFTAWDLLKGRDPPQSQLEFVFSKQRMRAALRNVKTLEILDKDDDQYRSYRIKDVRGMLKKEQQKTAKSKIKCEKIKTEKIKTEPSSESDTEPDVQQKTDDPEFKIRISSVQNVSTSVRKNSICKVESEDASKSVVYAIKSEVPAPRYSDELFSLPLTRSMIQNLHGDVPDVSLYLQQGDLPKRRYKKMKETAVKVNQNDASTTLSDIPESTCERKGDEENIVPQFYESQNDDLTSVEPDHWNSLNLE